MLVGHFAVGLIAKRVEPKVSLGTTTLASLLPDLLSFLFLIAGIEHVRFKPGIIVLPGMRALDALEAPDVVYSHSLLMGVVWGALLAAAYFARRYSAGGAAVIFIAVLSHWLLDFVSHPPDMPLAPSLDTRLGLGLWNSIPATLVVEGFVWVVGLVLSLRQTRAESLAGRIVFWIIAVVLTLAWINNITAPPPSELSVIGISSLIFFLSMIAATYWIDRLRANVSPPGKGGKKDVSIAGDRHVVVSEQRPVTGDCTQHVDARFLKRDLCQPSAVRRRFGNRKRRRPRRVRPGARVGPSLHLFGAERDGRGFPSVNDPG